MRIQSVLVIAIPLLLIVPGTSRAHCDTLDGPVVLTAREALETGKLNPMLACVRPQDEAEIRAAFTRARSVRKAGPDARSLADTWFFETLVRVHRAGEGAPYAGLKPAGEDLGPAVHAADAAIQARSPATVERLLSDGLKAGLHERFGRLMAEKRPGEDVAAGRAWVQAYVPYVHWVEGVHGAIDAGGGRPCRAPAEGPARGASPHAHPAPAH